MSSCHTQLSDLALAQDIRKDQTQFDYKDQ